MSTRASVRRWLVPLVVAVVAAVVGSGSVILFVDTGTAAGASIVLEPATSLGADPFTRSVTIGEVAQFPTTIHPVTRTVTAGLDPDPTTGGLTAAGDAPGLYGGTGDEHVCNPTRLADYLTHTPAKAAAWAAVLGITVHQIPDYVAELTPVVLTTDTRVTNHGFTNGGANPRPAVLQAGTAVLVDTHGIPRVKCGCGNPLTEPEARPLGETTGTPWTGYQPDHVTTITPTPRPQDTFTLTNITTGTTYTQPAGTSGGTSGTWLASTIPPEGGEGEFLMSASRDGGRTWTDASVPPIASGGSEGAALAFGDGRWVALESPHQGDSFGTAISTSTDARTWTPVVQIAPYLADAAFGDGRWLAVGVVSDATTAGTRLVVSSSTDGRAWAPTTPRGLPTDDTLNTWRLRSIAYGSHKWVLVADQCSTAAVGGGACQGTLFTSTDGTTWSRTATRFRGNASVEFGSGYWVVDQPARGQHPARGEDRDLDEP